jgi:hypothetical protein
LAEVLAGVVELRYDAPAYRFDEGLQYLRARRGSCSDSFLLVRLSSVATS